MIDPVGYRMFVVDPWWDLTVYTWRRIGDDFYRRMFGARLRGAKFTRELAGCVIP